MESGENKLGQNNLIGKYFKLAEEFKLSATDSRRLYRGMINAFVEENVVEENSQGEC